MALLQLIIAAQVVAATPPKLSVFDPLVGACWRADLSATVADTHCFEAMYGGAHVRDRHEVKENGRAVYLGETVYSRDGDETVFTYYNSLGGIGRGTVKVEGSTLVFDGTMRGSPSGKAETILTEWRIIDHDHYEVTTLTSRVRFARLK